MGYGQHHPGYNRSASQQHGPGGGASQVDFVDGMLPLGMGKGSNRPRSSSSVAMPSGLKHHYPPGGSAGPASFHHKPQDGKGR